MFNQHKELFLIFKKLKMNTSSKKNEIPNNSNMLYSFDFNAIEEMDPSLSKKDYFVKFIYLF